VGSEAEVAQAEASEVAVGSEAEVADAVADAGKSRN
jgi:hypothetical protein